MPVDRVQTHESLRPYLLEDRKRGAGGAGRGRIAFVRGAATCRWCVAARPDREDEGSSRWRMIRDRPRLVVAGTACLRRGHSDAGCRRRGGAECRSGWSRRWRGYWDAPALARARPWRRALRRRLRLGDGGAGLGVGGGAGELRQADTPRIAERWRRAAAGRAGVVAGVDAEGALSHVRGPSGASSAWKSLQEQGRDLPP
jgi:hypothetical protein